MPKKKRVSIILLNWNGWQMTLNCLKSLSLINTTGLEIEIVVVDNGSTDESVIKIRESIKRTTSTTGIISKKIDYHLIENMMNEGFAVGNNVGIKYALDSGADYVCLLNNDTRVDKNFLTELVHCAENNPKAGAVGGKIYFEKGHEFHKDHYAENDLGKVIWYAGGLIDWNNVYGSSRGVDEVDKKQYEIEQETEYVSGCLMFLRASAVKQVGLFNSKYFMYYEDTDLSMRLKTVGYSLVYCPKAMIWHVNAGSSASGSNLHDYFTSRNRLIFGMKWAPWRSKVALIRESARLLVTGRKWQKTGIRDFYLNRLDKGSWK